MKHVFGPVPSRRLGQSLGIDPVPLKTCNWNCVYCQLGRSRPLVNQQQLFYPCEEILSEVRTALTAHAPGDIDWITFVGSGETTLHAGIGKMIRDVKALTEIPVAVITNGTLLYLPEIRQALSLADAVLPSLDAGNALLYKKINRPYPSLTFERQIDGLKAFRKEYSGKLWIEVMLIKGLNDTEQALRELANLLIQIQPDEVHILTPDRPPVEPWVEPPDQEGLLRAQAILGDVAKLIHPASGSFDLSGSDSLVDAVIGIITRHPMREVELVETLTHWVPNDVNRIMQELAESERAQVIMRHGVRFWSASPAYYPE